MKNTNNAKNNNYNNQNNIFFLKNIFDNALH